MQPMPDAFFDDIDHAHAINRVMDALERARLSRVDLEASLMFRFPPFESRVDASVREEWVHRPHDCEFDFFRERCNLCDSARTDRRGLLTMADFRIVRQVFLDAVPMKRQWTGVREIAPIRLGRAPWHRRAWHRLRRILHV